MRRRRQGRGRGRAVDGLGDRVRVLRGGVVEEHRAWALIWVPVASPVSGSTV